MANETKLTISGRFFIAENTTTRTEYFREYKDLVKYSRDGNNFRFYFSIPLPSNFNVPSAKEQYVIGQNPQGTGLTTFLFSDTLDPSTGVVFVNADTMEAWIVANVGFFSKEVTLASPHFDAFNRLRVSGTGQRLDVEFIYDKQDEIFDEITNGAGTVTHDTNSRDLSLAVIATGTGDNAAMYSHPVPYTPGNSQLIAITGTINDNSIAGGTAEIFFRSKITGSVVETTYTQTAWSENTVSDVDWSTSQILEIDFQSLKVGKIRFYLNRSGAITPIHVIDNDNIRNEGYWQLPSLPLVWRIYNDATYTYMEMGYGNEDNAIGLRYKVPKDATALLRAICGTVKSEAGLDLKDVDGYNRTADMHITEKSVGNTLIPLLSIRPRSTFKGLDNLGLSIPLDAAVTGDNPIKLVIIHNCTLTDASWSDVDRTESAMEYDTSATSYTNGHVVHSGYVGSNKNQVVGGSALIGKTLLWNRQGTESGILTIAAIRTGGTSSDTLASIRWKEIR